MFAVTRSAFALVFALLGPVVAVASVVDARILRARTHRGELARFDSELAAAVLAVDRAHEAERSELQQRTRDVRTLVDTRATVVSRWERDDDTELQLRIGCADARSDLAVEGGAGAFGRATGDSAAQSALNALAARASRLSRAPVAIQAATGIGLVGPSVLCAATARGIALQLAASLSPARWSVAVQPGSRELDWIRHLPHGRTTSEGTHSIAFVSGSRTIAIQTARLPAALPSGLGCTLEVHADGTAVVAAERTALDLVGTELAIELAHAIRLIACQLGPGALVQRELPERLEFGAIPASSGDSTLASTVGVSTAGHVVVDLVGEGPHAVVAGTTGSGKSELLLSWVLGMAAERSPEVVSFLFVDFKGGASFGSLGDLPHSVGVLTDLEAERAERALASLAAELRHRERELAARALRSIDESETPPFPRLVVVVDEYAAVVDTLPALHAAFTDLAARGRSLGVHLVLCTQRPSGVVRDSILANCPLRLSLRVTAAADSVAVLGTDAAAVLPPEIRGRALVSAAGRSPLLVQVAKSDDTDVARVATRWAHAHRPRPLWLPPLPPVVSPAHLAEVDPSMGSRIDSVPFALADLPAEQAQRVEYYSPREHGSMLVLGAHRSGKSQVLTALECAPSTLEVSRVPVDIAAAWDALAEAIGNRDHPPRLLLLDDVDLAISGCPDGYQDAFADMVARLLREGPAAQTWLVLAAQRASGALSGLASLCGSRLVLRMADRADHALSGAETPFAVNLQPGGGYWHGNRIQVVFAERGTVPVAAGRVSVIDPASARLSVVSSRPEALAAVLRGRAPGRRVVLVAPAVFGAARDELEISHGGAPDILVADADTWQAQWSLLATLQRSGPVLFDGCSIAEFRALTRSRQLPPPFSRGEHPLWLRSVDGDVSRATLLPAEGHG